MGKKIGYCFLFVLLLLTMMKFGVDACLPYRSSALISMLPNRNIYVCENLSNWDQSARLARTRVFEVMAVPMSQIEKDAINPSVIGWGDLVLFWRIPLVLPLVLEQIPDNGTSTIKLISFAVSSSIFLALILHYFGLVYKAVTEILSTGGQRANRTEKEQRVTSLMGRLDASNNIVVTKKNR